MAAVAVRTSPESRCFEAAVDTLRAGVQAMSAWVREAEGAPGLVDQRRVDGAANLALLCRPHHRMVHDEGWALERQKDGRFGATPPTRRVAAHARSA